MIPVPRGRPARPATAGWNLTKTLVQTALFWGLFLLAIPASLVLIEDALQLERWRFANATTRILGAILFVAASALGLWSGIVMAIRGRGTPLPFDGTRELVIAGPYRFVRNPMAVAGLTQGAAVGLYLGSPLVVIYVTIGLLLWDRFVRRWEERDLAERFGESYRIYRRRVRCWRPRLAPYDPAREEREPPLAAERTTAPGRHVLLYDGACPFCSRQVRRLLELARPGAVEALSAQDSSVPLRFPGIPAEALARSMHLVLPGGLVVSGFEAAVRAVATRPLAGWLAYVYFVPGIRLLCDCLYGFIAANRYRLFGRSDGGGSCPDGTCSIHRGTQKAESDV